MAETEQIDVKLTTKDAEKDEKVNLWGGLDAASIIEKHKIPLSVALLGLVLVLGGIFLIIKSGQGEDKIEIIPSEKTEKTAKNIFADIEGAIIKPGVYEIPDGSRINDLLIAAGGISMDADREWVEKNLNKAQRLTDGMKIYVPDKKEGGRVKGEVGSGKMEAGSKSVIDLTSRMININTASATELDTLWGVGPATAKKIIDNRPYGSIEDLVSKKAVSKSVFERIKGEISVY